MTALTSKLLGIGCWIVLLTSIVLTRTSHADEALDQLVQLEQQYNARRKAGRIQEALPIAEELLARARRDFSHVPELVIIALNYLGADYFNLGRYDESVKAYRESLSLAEKKFGPDSVEVAATSIQLGNTYFTMQNFGQSEKLYARCIAVGEKVHGHEHPETARGYHNLAGTYMAQGRYAEAESNYHVALKSTQKPSDSSTPTRQIRSTTLAC